MRITELLRLVWININQNKFKSVLTSIGIVAGAATIVLVIGIGQGGQMEVAEQFAELNAGAIDVTYEYEGEEERSQSGGFSMGSAGQFFDRMFGGMGMSGNFNAEEGRQRYGGQNNGQRAEEGQNPDSQDLKGDEEKADGEKPAGNEERQEGQESESDSQEQESETGVIEERLNQEEIVLTQEDVEDIEKYVNGITGAAISYSTKAAVEGGNLLSSQTYTVAGVKESFCEVSRLEMAEGEFLTNAQDQSKERVCVLGSSAARELFGSAQEAVGETIYIDDRTYLVAGVLQSSQTVSAGISPDTSIMIPYETGIKYITGTGIEPVVTVIAEDVNVLENVIADVRTVLEERHVNARFTFEDSGSKMQAARSSNRTLTMLLSAMAAIVFLVGGIGIMNVLFVSVKERTSEIGILKAIGTPRSNILIEFLIESAAISFIGGILGVLLGFAVIPVAGWLDVRVEAGIWACLAALGFAVLTGTIFGIYPAWKASRLEPVEALNTE